MRTNALRGWPPSTGRAPRFPGLRVPRAPDLRRDTGFTLIETIVALGIATVVFTALAYAATTAVSSTFAARMNQQAIDLATQTMETTRALGYASIGHDAADLAADPAVQPVAGCGTECYDTAVGTTEPLVVIAAGGISSHQNTVTVNNVPYTVSTYVTWPEEATEAEYKRVTVVVAWTFKDQANERVMSSLVSEYNSGLPLPDFQLTPLGETTQSVNPGGDAAYGFTIVNQGAPEQYTISIDAGSWSVYFDDGDGVLDTDTDELSDSTGRMDPNDERVFWVVRKSPLNSEADGTTSYTVSAASVAQEGTVQSVIITLVIDSGVIGPSTTPSPTSSITGSPTPTPTPSQSEGITTCTDANPAADPNPGSDNRGYSIKAYTLHNTGTTSWPPPPPSPGEDDPWPPSTTALSPMYMDLDAPAVPAGFGVPVYSSDIDPADTGGRILDTGGYFDMEPLSDARPRVAEWRTTENRRQYQNEFVLRLWVAQVPGISASSGTLSMQVFTYNTKTNNRTAVGSAVSQPFDLSSCPGWQGISFTASSGSLNLNNNEVLGVQVWNSGSTMVRIAYDHETLPGSLTVVER